MRKPADPIASKDDIAKAKARAVADKYFEPDGATPKGTGGPEAQIPPAEKRLTPKEFKFCEEYLVDLNGTQAAIRAGYSKKTASVIAYENLRKPHIAKCVAELMKERSRKTSWTAEKLLQRLGNELEADLLDIHNPDGSLKPMDEWPLEWRQGLIEGLKIREELTPDGELIVARIVEYKTAGRGKIKEMIGKHVGVQAFKEKVEHDLSDPVKQLYAQIAGTGIGPRALSDAPGLVRPAPSSIRPVDPAPIDTPKGDQNG